MAESTEKTAIERVQIARHPLRPYTMDLFSSIFEEFVEIHGDRRYADDPALVCGLARLDGVEVLAIGQQKGRDTKQRQVRNFGMPKPEGYRKALRAMKLAAKFGRPIVSLVDTPGAYPGIDAEERGQAEAIAFNLREMAGLRVPIIVVVLGEGGSGGALAIGIGDRILMMENSVYSVISPEGCAAILWKDAAKADLAAKALKLTAIDLKDLGLVDEVIPEKNGAWEIDGEAKNGGNEKHVFAATAEELKRRVSFHLRDVSNISPSELVKDRYKKFRKMGKWV